MLHFPAGKFPLERVPIAFAALSYSQQLRYVQPVEDAKAAATRQRRIDKVLSDLRPG